MVIPNPNHVGQSSRGPANGISVAKPSSPAAAPTGHAPLQLRLYVSGNAPNSASAVANAKMICEKHFPGRSNIEIVDLLAHPLRALADGVIVTPTLIRLLPLPVMRIVGNLSDTTQVLLALGNA